MPCSREIFCEVLFIKNATATSMYQKVIRQSLYKMAWHISRLPKMAVTTNCKQFFFLKSTVLQHLQQKYKSPKIKHLFSFKISREAQKKPNNCPFCTESKTIHKNGMFNVKNQIIKPILHILIIQGQRVRQCTKWTMWWV